MITIKDAHVLLGNDMEVRRTNIIMDESQIIEISDRTGNGKVIDGRHCVAAPSLINSHVHIGDSVAMDVGDGEPIEKIVKPPTGIKHRILSQTPDEEIVTAMKSTMNYMIQTGTTTFVDFREGDLKGIELIEKAGEDIPIGKIVLGRHYYFFNSGVNLSELKNITENILRYCDGIGLSGLDEIEDNAASVIAGTCREHGKLSAIHVAEYEELQCRSMELKGLSEVERALRIGFDLLVHMTAPVEDDLQLVGESGTSVVSCPRSNGSLGVGIPPLKDMLDRGINVCLGTDNVMFNSPNMFKEMEYALKVTRGYYKQHVPAVDVFKMATVNPAMALGLNSGSIEEGKTADIMLIDGLSGDPVLSVINRTESQNIKTLIREGNILFER